MISSPPPRPPPPRPPPPVPNRIGPISSRPVAGAAGTGAGAPSTKASSKEIKPKAPLPPLEIWDKRNQKIWIRKELLGEGGFAKCFRITEKGANQQHMMMIDNVFQSNLASPTDSAVKVVWKQSLKSGKQRQKLLSEIKIHQSLAHPNIVLFKNVFEDDENVYIILELCEQKTFVDLIKKRKRLTDSEVRFWMYDYLLITINGAYRWQLLDGIRYMHRKGYIHRDIKLGNLFLDSKLNLKIGDFGLAAQIEHDGERKKTICGTPNYIAPEILFDTKNGHSFEVDIWSLGVVMYTLLIGKPPFQTKDVKAIYKNIRDNLYQFPDNVPITTHAKEIITAFLHPKPEKRPSIDDVLEHPYFDRSLVPRCVPLIALAEVPVFEFDQEDIFKPNISSPMQRVKSHVTLRSPAHSPAPPKLPPRSLMENGDVVKPLSLPSRAIQTLSGLPPRSPLNTAKYTDSPPQNKLIQRLSQASLKSPVSSPSVKNSPSWVDTPEKYSRSSPSQYNQHNYSSDNQENMSPSLKSSTNSLSTSLSVAMAVPANAKPTSASSSSESSPSTQSKTKKDSPPTKSGSALDQIYSVLKGEIKRAASLSSQPALPINSADSAPHPSVYITKWIDYTNKYGLSYQFRDGSVGVYFNDGTSIILSQNGSSFEYLYYDRSGDRPVMHRRHHSLDSPPADLSKKITLLKHFRGYMIENLTRASASDFAKSGNEQAAQSIGMDFLTKYVRTKQGVLFRISNHSIQLNLFDHTKLIISEGGMCITFINAQRYMETRPIGAWINCKNQDVLKRIIYCAELIEKTIIKSKA